MYAIYKTKYTSINVYRIIIRYALSMLLLVDCCTISDCVHCWYLISSKRNTLIQFNVNQQKGVWVFSLNFLTVDTLVTSMNVLDVNSNYYNVRMHPNTGSCARYTYNTHLSFRL